MRPNYKLPSRKKLGGSILDAIHIEMEELIHESLEGREDTFVIDG